MARYRWTFALILICLPILATVITAFRIRDLPKSSHDAPKSDLRTRKCEDCDVNELKVGQKSYSVKIESEKKFEPLKKSVADNKIKQYTDRKSSFEVKDDSEDDDDDDDIPLLKSQNGFRREETSKVVNTGKPGSSALKQGSSRKPSFKIDDDDNDDDDYDDDDDDDETVKGKPSTSDVKGKSSGGSKPLIKESLIKKSDLKMKSIVHKDEDDDDDDDDDDEDDDDEEEDKDANSGIAAARKILSDIDAKNAKSGGKSSLDVRLTKDEKIKKGEPKDKKAKENKEATIKEIRKDSKPQETFKLLKETPAESKKPSELKKDKIIETRHEDAQNIKKPIELEKVKHAPKKELIINKEEKKETKPIKVDDMVNKETVKKVEINKEAKKQEVKKEEVKKHEQKEELTRHEKKEQPEHKPKEDKVNKDHKAPKKDEVKKPEKKDSLEVKSKEDENKATSKPPEPKKEHKHQKKDKSVEEVYDSHEVKSETHQKQVKDAVRRRNLLQSEFEDFYAFFPTFAPNFSRIHNPECRRHGQILLRQLRGTKLWALNMLDATAKIPSGLLQGNGIQLGDFDQCLGCRARVQLETGSVVRVQGKYCLARLDVRAEAPELELPVHLAQAKNLIKSRIDDPGHFVPRFSTLSWGVCVPAACEPSDVEVVIKDAILHYQHTSGLVVRVKVDEADCHVPPGSDWWEAWLETPTLVTLSFYAVVVLLVLVATAQDFLAGRKSDGEAEADEQAECDQKETEEKETEIESKRPDGFLNAFSLYRTIAKLVAPGSADEIACIHGVRGLATIALLVAHKFLPVAVMPYTNRTRIAEVVSSPLWSWCRAGWIFTDCFLLISGALMAHKMSDSSSGAPKRLLSRYLRLTPALLAVVLFYAYVWDNLSQGPMWGTLVTKNAEICQESWWWNILYVQNYFGFDEMCAPQTHQLALDMQLYLIGGLLVWGIQTNAQISKLVLLAIHLMTAYSRFTTTRDHRLTMLAYHGVSVSQLYRTATMSYTSVFHRSSPYLIGLSLGLALKKPSAHGKIVLTLGWLLSTALVGAVLWAGMDSGYPQYRYSATFAAQYSAFAPIASALAFAWIIYVVHSGNCEFLSGILCWRPLVLISRLSYALYLCQFIVFLSLAGTVRSSKEFTLAALIDIEEISYVLLSATVLTLTFVIPIQSLHKISFQFSLPSTSEPQEEESSETKAEKTEEEVEEKEEIVENDIIEVPQIRSRQHLVAHREVLEEIPEVEVEYEAQRAKAEGLEEILEEEEDEELIEEVGDEEVQDREDEDLEIIEEEQGGEDDFWGDREEYPIRRPYSRNQSQDDDHDLDEWEWTANGSGRSGAQYYRYSR